MVKVYFLSFVFSFLLAFGYLYYFDSYRYLKSFPFSDLIDRNYQNFLKGDYSALRQIPSSGKYIYVDEKMFREVR
jgi:hypothetical protein